MRFSLYLNERETGREREDTYSSSVDITLSCLKKWKLSIGVCSFEQRKKQDANPCGFCGR